MNHRHRTSRTVSCTAALMLAGPAFAQDSAPAKTLHVFQDGQAQPVPGFADPKEWIRHELWVEAPFDSDGSGKPDRLHVVVTRPKQTDTEELKVPVIYETSPYFSGIGSTESKYFWDPKHELGAKPPARNPMPDIPHKKVRLDPRAHGVWLQRGFAVVLSESPGTGQSQGCPTCGGPNEALAPKAVIDWLNGRAKGFTTPDGDETVTAGWCTGKVGMIGTSYNGTLPVAAATTGVEGLEAIIPVAPNTSYYHYYRSHGLVRHPDGYMGEDVDVLYDFINSGDPQRRAWCNEHVRDAEMRKNQDRLTGDYNDFWAGRDYLLQLGKWRAATLMAHAFNDWNVMPEHSVRIYAALKKQGIPCMAYFHQGGHGGNPPLPLMNRWFTRFLFGVENGVEKDPRAWIVREGDAMGKPTPYPDYPHPEAAMVTLRPQAGGNAVGALATSAASGQKHETLVDDVSIKGGELAKAERSEHRLLYATPELKAPLHVSGTARLKIRLAADKPAANLSVWVVLLPGTPAAAGEPAAESRPRRTGRERPTDTILTRGWADPQNHRSLRESEALVAGRFYELTFDLQPDDQVVPAGKRLGLMLFSSDREYTLWPPPGTKLTVDLGATALELPVVGGAAAYAKAVGEGDAK